ncbi:MAG: polysaccharide deacetylase family protein [Pyrinomonadaceae bacterium]
MLKTLKQNLLKSTKTLGLFDFAGNSRWRRNKLLILAYHGISLADEHLWNSSLFVPADFLRRRFEIIKQHGCNVLPLGEAIEKLYAGDLPEKSVVITFDDGNYDFFRQALPIIKEFNFPATVYLTTFYSEFNKPVFVVAVDYLLWTAKTKTLRLNDLTGRDEEISLANETKRMRAYRLIIAHADDNDFSAARKNEMLAAMCAELGIDYAEFCRQRILQLMNADEAAQVAASGVDVQLHTHRHRVPPDEKLFTREIEDNRRAIERATGGNARAKHFCYPSGEHAARFFPWMRAAKIVSATTCETALATASTNPFLLPRLVDTCPLSEIEFEGWLSGVSQFLPQRRNL